MKHLKITLALLLVGLWSMAQTVTPNPGPYTPMSQKYQYPWLKTTGGIWNPGKLIVGDSAQFSGITYVIDPPDGDSSTLMANTAWVLRNSGTGGGGSNDTVITKFPLYSISGSPHDSIAVYGVDSSFQSAARVGDSIIFTRFDGTTQGVYAPVGGGGGTTKYSTNEWGILIDSATTDLYKIRGDSSVLASKTYVDNKDALKLNISDTAAMLAHYKDSIAAHNTRLIGKQTNITLTTTGTSGASTFNQSTGALNIPEYAGGAGALPDSLTITPNIFAGLGLNDVEKIQRALDTAISQHKKLLIPFNKERGSKYWMIDSAILLRSNAYIVIQNAVLKLTDSSRDNIMRTVNCGLGITNPWANPLENITIQGIGEATLEGADNPRSTGDNGKTLTLTPTLGLSNSYGTDAGISGRTQTGDWRNHGAIIAYTSNVVFSGIKLSYMHAYGVSFERCSNVNVFDIVANMPGYAAVGGTARGIKNNGAIDFCQSIRDVYVNNVSGISADDNIALNIVNVTAGIFSAGSYGSGHAAGDTSNSAIDSIYNVNISNVNSKVYDNSVRILVPPNGCKASNISISNITNGISPSDSLYSFNSGANTSVVVVGSNNPVYGGNNPFGQISKVTINNIKSEHTKYGVWVQTTLSESTVYNIYKGSTVYASTAALYGDTPSVRFRNIVQYALDGTTWNVTGNPDLNSSSNFIGTRDSVDLQLRVFNTTRLRLSRSLATASTELYGRNLKTSIVPIVDYYDNAASLRSRITHRGTQEWYINNGTTDLGSIQFGSPGGLIGMLFLNTAGNSRSDFSALAAGGFLWGSASPASLPPAHMQLNVSGQLSIGTTSPATASLFHVSSTTKAVLLAPKTTTQQTAMSSLTAGLTHYNTDLKRMTWYDGTAWRYSPTAFTGTAAPATTPVAVGDTFTDTVGLKMYVATGTASSADWTILN
jgi:hypothetical protein